jgi:RNA polymerase sigma-70 factor (ECF subfamily)
LQEAGEGEERAAIARLRAGDIDALEFLVRRFQMQALEAAYLITRNYPMAEDVVQSAFVNAYEHISQLQDGRPFGPWFLRSVVNRALTSIGQDNRHNTLLSNNPPSQASPELGTDVERIVEGAETRDEILSAIEQLTPSQRAAIVLRYYLDLSDNEVASRLDIPRGTVRRRLHDARQRLRVLLTSKFG